MRKEEAIDQLRKEYKHYIENGSALITPAAQVVIGRLGCRKLINEAKYCLTNKVMLLADNYFQNYDEAVDWMNKTTDELDGDSPSSAISLDRGHLVLKLIRQLIGNK